MKTSKKEIIPKPLEIYIQEVYELAKTLEIEPIKFDEFFPNLKQTNL